MVAKIFPKTITCVKAKAPVKTDGDIDEGLEAYTDVDTIKNLKLWHWSIPRLFLCTGQECCRQSEKLPEKKLYTIRSTLADLMTEALFHSVADKLAEIEAEKPGDTLADVKVETTLPALSDTRPKVEAETLAYTSPKQ